LDLEQLKHKNSADTQEVSRSYPPENYWIPKVQWNSIANLLTHNLPLLPEIFGCMDTLAAEESMAYYYNEMSKTLRNLTDSQSDHQREMSSQAGKMSEQNSRWVRDLEASLKKQTEQHQKNLWKCLSILIGAQTIFLSLLTILLTWILR